jgi:RNA polymerase sigma-70 factor, ECF subfamily
MIRDSTTISAIRGNLPGMTGRDGGDEDEFRRLVEPHQTALHAHCYRMLGSVHDADDALQDALVRAWRGMRRFEGRSAPRTWLHRIATNACLDALARRRRRVLPVGYGPSADPPELGRRLEHSTWVEPFPDVALEEGDGAAPEARYEAREAVELAFVAALQHLPPRQRAVLILRDVLGFSSREAADALATTNASVNSALQRARKTIGQRLPARSQQATIRLLGDVRLRNLVERLIDAFERGDVDVIVALLAEDATFEMPPFTGWCRGRDAIAASWLMPERPPSRLRCVPTWANAQPAMGTYALDPAGGYVPIALDVLTLTGDRVGAVTAFRTPEIFARFGLPPRLAG